MLKQAKDSAASAIATPPRGEESIRAMFKCSFELEFRD